MKLPVDVINKANELFINEKERLEAMAILRQVSNTNVEDTQLIRSLLIICDGKIEIIKSIVASNYYGDARKVILEAEDKLGNPETWGCVPFGSNPNEVKPKIHSSANV